MSLTCFECKEPLEFHRLDCGSEYITEKYAYVLDNLHRLPYDYLDRLVFEIFVSQQERLNALKELSTIGQEMEDKE